MTVTSGTNTVVRNAFVSGSPENFAYDLDGNIISDGKWLYTWDAENRLTKMESHAGAPSASRRKVEYEYDYMGRRVVRRVTNLYTGTTSETRFVYDDWNVLAEMDGANVVTRSYTWGLDLSGTIQGAGGVGGLLKVRNHLTPAKHHFVMNDGNGNVTALVDADTGSFSARYEYGPFGEPIRVTGPMGNTNPLRWSTKYTDDETDLVYYGHRYYNPSTGRWLSRDPIGEEGGPNLYAFVHNDPINRFDPFGLDESWQVEGDLVPPKNANFHWYFKADFKESSCQLNLSLNLNAFLMDDDLKTRALYRRLKDRWASSVSKRYGGWKLIPSDPAKCCKCKNGVEIKFNITFSDEFSDPTRTILIYNDFGPSDAGNWYLKDVRPGSGLHFTVPNYIGVSHEVGHLFGLYDEYRDPKYPDRFIPNDSSSSIMGTGTSVKQRHIERIVLENANVNDHLTCPTYKVAK